MKRKFNPPQFVSKPAGSAVQTQGVKVSLPSSEGSDCKILEGDDVFVGGDRQRQDQEVQPAQPQQPAAHRVFKPLHATLPRPSGWVSKPGLKVGIAPPPMPGLASGCTVKVFTVLYCKKELLTKKKASKKYQDGFLEMQQGGRANLFDKDGKLVTKGKSKGSSTIELGSWSMEVDTEVDIAEFKSGACFMPASSCSAPTTTSEAPDGLLCPPTIAPFKAVARPSAATAGGSTAGTAATAPLPTSPHDLEAEGALLMNAAQWQGGAGRLANGQPVVPVVLDPYVGRNLRPHQREGVAFMYDAVMGVREPGKLGCILADAMGLGKTLQIIALSWTLLRQGPTGRPIANKVIVVTPATLVKNWEKEVKKWLGSERLQVCLTWLASSLLNRHGICMPLLISATMEASDVVFFKAMALTQGPEAKQRVQDFKHGNLWRMLIVSYETLRKHSEELAGVCGLLVCDEGHRLKAIGGNKTIDSLLQLQCQRRILLTGTPVQNNLEEFYALLAFCVPDLLGPPAVFKRVYSEPISRSRDRDATEADKALGAARAEELQRKVGTFVLRRTQEILAKHLPPLSVYVLFCRPSTSQVQLYEGILKSKAVSSILHSNGGGGDDNSLAIITALRKLCNHPGLLMGAATQQGEDLDEDATASINGGSSAAARSLAGASAWLPDTTGMTLEPSNSITASGKLAVLQSLLTSILGGGQRCVVVSTSTAMLHLVDTLLCQKHGWRTVRIDGSVSVDERQNIVDAFNNLGIGKVFLLSTCAGGAGLNLVGASSLVLVDSHWNPAHDEQAMARIWRDGQKQPCTVYRLLTTGSIEEKVYQRQLMKGDLASATMASGGAGSSGKKGGKNGADGQFTRDELKQLFLLDTTTACATRELLQHHTPPLLHWLNVDQPLPTGSCAALHAAVLDGVVSCVAQANRGAAAGSDDPQQVVTAATVGRIGGAAAARGEKPAAVTKEEWSSEAGGAMEEDELELDDSMFEDA